MRELVTGVIACVVLFVCSGAGWWAHNGEVEVSEVHASPRVIRCASAQSNNVDTDQQSCDIGGLGFLGQFGGAVNDLAAMGDDVFVAVGRKILRLSFDDGGRRLATSGEVMLSSTVRSIQPYRGGVLAAGEFDGIVWVEPAESGLREVATIIDGGFAPRYSDFVVQGDRVVVPNGEGASVIDISLMPPEVVYSIPIGIDGAVYVDLAVDGGMLYLGAAHRGGAGSIRIVNALSGYQEVAFITLKAAPQLIALLDGKMFIYERAYDGGGMLRHALIAYDVKTVLDDSAPSPWGRWEYRGPVMPLEEIVTILPKENHLLVFIAEKGVVILDKDLTTPDGAVKTQVSEMDLDGVQAAVRIGDNVYVALGQDGVVVIDVESDEAPQVVAAHAVGTRGRLRQVAVQQDAIYVAGFVGVEEPSIVVWKYAVLADGSPEVVAMVELDTVETDGGKMHMSADGEYVYVAHDNSVDVIQADGRSQLHYVTSWTHVEAEVVGIVAEGKTVVVASAEALTVFDVTTGTRRRLTLPHDARVRALAVDEGVVAVASHTIDERTGLHLSFVDAIDAQSLEILYETSFEEELVSIAIDRNTIYTGGHHLLVMVWETARGSPGKKNIGLGRASPFEPNYHHLSIHDGLIYVATDDTVYIYCTDVSNEPVRVAARKIGFAAVDLDAWGRGVVAVDQNQGGVLYGVKSKQYSYLPIAYSK